jgi:hypothetical protein
MSAGAQQLGVGRSKRSLRQDCARLHVKSRRLSSQTCGLFASADLLVAVNRLNGALELLSLFPERNGLGSK